MKQSININRHILLFTLITFTFQLEATVWNKLNKQLADSIYQVGCNYTYSYPDSTLIIASQLHEQSTIEQFEYGLKKAQLMAGFHYASTLRLDTAEAILNELIESLEYKNSKENKILKAQALCYLGNAHFRGSKSHQAKEDLSEAIEIFQSFNMMANVGECEMILGNIERVLHQNSSLALDHFLKAYRLLLDSGKPKHTMVNIIQCIAEVYVDMGHYQKAIEYEREIVGLDSVNLMKKGFLYHSIGKHFMFINQYDSSLIYLKKSLEIANTLKAAEIYLSSIHYSLADTYMHQMQYLKSLHSLKQIKSLHHLDRTHSLKAKNYFGLNQYDKAIYYGRKVYSRVTSNLKPNSIIAISELLYQSYEKSGKSDSALFFFKKYHEVKDSVYNLENQRKLSSLFAEVETLEKQKEIEELEAKNQLTAAKTKNLKVILSSGILISGLIISILLLSNRNRKKSFLLQKYQLQSEIEEKIQDLSQQSVRIIQKNNSITELEDGLKKIKKGLVNGQAQEVQHMLNTIRLSKVVDKEWDKFDEHFGSFNQDFMECLDRKHPDLTVTEKRLAILVKNGFTNREVSELMNIEIKSVRMAKYRLKKKLGLMEDMKLLTYLTSLERPDSLMQA